MNDRHIFTVSDFNREVRNSLERNFSLVWLAGEISNLACPSSGHWYFSLKDSQAQVRCAMFRTRNRAIKFVPKNGSQVLLLAKVSLYEPRGEFQLLVEHMEAAGDGALQRQFEQLKQRLANEGLFDPTHKKTLPRLPRRIGIITSPHGAAVKDVLTVLKRRFPAIPVLIYPSLVQGENAPAEIVQAIHKADQGKHCDVLIMCRGGGSIEDLWCFNSEQVARAMYQCQIPIVSAVGHETDVTIADFVADVRAPTPSAAAELVSPNKAEWIDIFSSFENRLIGRMRALLQQRRKHTQWLYEHLQHPRQRLQSQAQRLDELEQRLTLGFQSKRKQSQIQLDNATVRLTQQSPIKKLPQLKWQLDTLSQRLGTGMAHIMDDRNQQLVALTRALEAVSPLATMGRGYAIVRKYPDREILRSTQSLQIGDQIEAELYEAKIICTVDELQQKKRFLLNDE